MKLPEKRKDILYSRITSTNKEFLQMLADREQISESALVNHIIDFFREHAEVKKQKKK